MKEKLLQTDKGRVYYWQSNNWNVHADTLFFLHGLTADHSMFDEQIAYFKKEYNVLTWDAPAHGKSRPFESFSFNDAAAYIKTYWMNAVSKNNSCRADLQEEYFAQSFIKRYPDYTKTFVSISSTPYGCGYYSKFDVWILKQVEWMANLYPFELMKRRWQNKYLQLKKAYDNMLQMLAPYTKREMCHLMGLCYAGFLKDNCNLEINCPVLLILGEKDKTGKVKQYNREWAKQTGYSLEIIRGAAHNANVDKPQEVNDCIRKFLLKTF